MSEEKFDKKLEKVLTIVDEIKDTFEIIKLKSQCLCATKPEPNKKDFFKILNGPRTLSPISSLTTTTTNNYALTTTVIEETEILFENNNIDTNKLPSKPPLLSPIISEDDTESEEERMVPNEEKEELLSDKQEIEDHYYQYPSLITTVNDEKQTIINELKTEKEKLVKNLNLIKMYRTTNNPTNNDNNSVLSNETDTTDNIKIPLTCNKETQSIQERRNYNLVVQRMPSINIRSSLVTQPTLHLSINPIKQPLEKPIRDATTTNNVQLYTYEYKYDQNKSNTNLCFKGIAHSPDVSDKNNIKLPCCCSDKNLPENERKACSCEKKLKRTNNLNKLCTEKKKLPQSSKEDQIETINRALRILNESPDKVNVEKILEVISLDTEDIEDTPASIHDVSSINAESLPPSISDNTNKNAKSENKSISKINLPDYQDAQTNTYSEYSDFSEYQPSNKLNIQTELKSSLVNVEDTIMNSSEISKINIPDINDHPDIFSKKLSKNVSYGLSSNNPNPPRTFPSCSLKTLRSSISSNNNSLTDHSYSSKNINNSKDSHINILPYKSVSTNENKKLSESTDSISNIIISQQQDLNDIQSVNQYLFGNEYDNENQNFENKKHKYRDVHSASQYYELGQGYSPSEVEQKLNEPKEKIIKRISYDKSIIHEIPEKENSLQTLSIDVSTSKDSAKLSLKNDEPKTPIRKSVNYDDDNINGLQNMLLIQKKNSKIEEEKSNSSQQSIVTRPTLQDDSIEITLRKNQLKSHKDDDLDNNKNNSDKDSTTSYGIPKNLNEENSTVLYKSSYLSKKKYRHFQLRKSDNFNSSSSSFSSNGMIVKSDKQILMKKKPKSLMKKNIFEEFRKKCPKSAEIYERYNGKFNGDIDDTDDNIPTCIKQDKSVSRDDGDDDRKINKATLTDINNASSISEGEVKCPCSDNVSFGELHKCPFVKKLANKSIQKDKTPCNVDKNKQKNLNSNIYISRQRMYYNSWLACYINTKKNLNDSSHSSNGFSSSQ